MGTFFGSFGFILPLLISFSLYSQQNPSELKLNKYQNEPVGSSSSSGTSVSGGMLHTPTLEMGEECGMYLNESWLPGTIVMKDQTVIAGKLYRFNLYTGQMEYADGMDTAAIGNPEELDYLKIGERKFIFRTIKEGDHSFAGYMEVLSDGKCKLLCSRLIKYTFVEYPEGPDTESIGKYYMKKTIYYTMDDSAPELLPMKKKQVIQIFEDRFPDIKNYLKSSRNNLKSIEDFITLFEFFNHQT